MTASKSNTWKEFGDKMERHSKDHQTLFYKVLKSLRSDKTANTNLIKDKNGELLSEGEEIIVRWREYFQELLNTGRETEENIEQEEDLIENVEEDIFFNNYILLVPRNRNVYNWNLKLVEHIINYKYDNKKKKIIQREEKNSIKFLYFFRHQNKYYS